MHVVSDTSPLSCLASIQRLDLIQQQFGVVHVPTSVAKVVIYELQENFAFSLSPSLVETALREVGER